MSCEGAWKLEIQGPFGWERAGTAFMTKGRYLASSANYYAVGNYKTDGDAIIITAQVRQYGDFRTLFGKKDFKQLHLKSTGQFSKNEITGTTTADEGRQQFKVHFRYTRLGNID